VTDTTQLAVPASGAAETSRPTGGLSALRLAELQALAGSLGLAGTAKMRKNDLVSAIRSRQSGGSAAATAATDTAATAATDNGAAGSASTSRGPANGGSRRNGSSNNGTAGHGSAADGFVADNGRAAGSHNGSDGVSTDAGERAGTSKQGGAEGAAARGARLFTNHDTANGSGTDATVETPEPRSDAPQGAPTVEAAGGQQGERRQFDRRPEGRADRNDRGNGRNDRANDRTDRANDRGTDRGNDRNDYRPDRGNDTRNAGGTDTRNDRVNTARDDDDRNGRRRGRQRYRDRKRRGPDGDANPADNYSDNQDYGSNAVADDDVLVPVAGILDVLDSYAFVRTSGYLPGPGDVYVPLGIVKKNGLRKGDAVTGAVKALREGEQVNARQKFNALIRLDTVNGMSPEDSKARVDFGKLTPLYPQERLRLETESNILTTRIIDLVAPIGKGQRGLIVSPPKAGKTLILQAIANAIAVNNPEAHLMIVLVDERPEEVTDMQRTVKGEVIASTFDRPAEDHTTVAELAIERAKRLVEMGHDVVVLLDSITRLGRAYNLAAPASGRILSGGVDSSALYPPKRFFGAARNIENGGSLTILATALVETGSKMDEVIFEEFKGTGNMELRLSRTLADRRIFPAVDVNPSGTRREEILMAPDELKITWRLRRVLSALDQQQGIELLLDRLKKTRNNTEFLMQVQKTSSIQGADED
jgi:transcription termination factor Rho